MPVDKSEKRVRQMFGEIAGSYDFLNHLLSMNIDRYWRWRTVRRTRPNGHGPILDLCTGTADLALAYASATRGRTPIVAADFSHPMLVRGQEKSRRYDLQPNITFVESDAQRLPFADETFQLVTIAFGLRNVTDTDLGLREMTRVCRPGGKVAVLEFSTPTAPVLRQTYQWYFRHVLPRIGQALSRNGHEAYRYLPASVGEFPAGESLAERMRQAGLARVEFFPLTLGVATLYVGIK